MNRGRLAACIIVGVLVAVVVYVWFQETPSAASSAKGKSDRKASPPPAPSVRVDEKEEITKEKEDREDRNEVAMDEGVIKYECEWHKGRIELDSIQSLLHARNKLHDLGLIEVYKHNNIGFGNISQRIESKRQGKVPFYITGTQTSNVHNADMNESHFSMVHNYDIPQNKLFCTGPMRASSESMTHATVYELDESIKCVVHIHDRILWKRCMDTLPTTDRNIRYGTPEMAKEVERLYRENVCDMQHVKVFVMGGHEDGLIAFGESIEAATDLMIKVYRRYGGERENETESSKSGEEESTTTAEDDHTVSIDKTMNINIIDNYATPVMTSQSHVVNDDANINGKNGAFVQVETDQLTL